MPRSHWPQLASRPPPYSGSNTRQQRWCRSFYTPKTPREITRSWPRSAVRNLESKTQPLTSTCALRRPRAIATKRKRALWGALHFRVCWHGGNSCNGTFAALSDPTRPSQTQPTKATPGAARPGHANLSPRWPRHGGDSGGSGRVARRSWARAMPRCLILCGNVLGRRAGEVRPTCVLGHGWPHRLRGLLIPLAGLGPAIHGFSSPAGVLDKDVGGRTQVRPRRYQSAIGQSG